LGSTVTCIHNVTGNLNIMKAKTPEKLNKASLLKDGKKGESE
jgi:hypothetical protein